MWEDLIWIEFRTTKYFSFCKRGRSIHILGLHRHFFWVRLGILVMDEMSLEVWNSMWASCLQMKRDPFILSCKGNLSFCFSQGVNSIRGHKSSRLVLRKCFRGDKTILIWKSACNNCFVLVACKYSEISLFFSYKG